VEYSTTDVRQAGISGALSLLNDKLKLQIGAAPAGDNSVVFTGTSLSVIAAAMRNDSHFKVKTEPSMRLLNNQSAKLQIGDSEPTLGGTTVSGTGLVTQNVVYQNAGVQFSLHPQILEKGVVLKIEESINQFSPTVNSAIGSPTISTRSLNTVANVEYGEVIFVGGLSQVTTVRTRSAFPWFDISLGTSNSEAQTEIILALELTKV
jgi:general secretion pathway protein D